MEYYEKTEWATGDVVDAEKLNNIENGVSLSYPIIISAYITRSGNVTTTVTELTPEMLSDVGFSLVGGMKSNIIVNDNGTGAARFESIVELYQSNGNMLFSTLAIGVSGQPTVKHYSLNTQSGFYECAESEAS